MAKGSLYSAVLRHRNIFVSSRLGQAKESTRKIEALQGGEIGEIDSCVGKEECWMFSFEAEGFSCTLDVLYGELRIDKL